MSLSEFDTYALEKWRGDCKAFKDRQPKIALRGLSKLTPESSVPLSHLTLRVTDRPAALPHAALGTNASVNAQPGSVSELKVMTKYSLICPNSLTVCLLLCLCNDVVNFFSRWSRGVDVKKKNLRWRRLGYKKDCTFIGEKSDVKNKWTTGIPGMSQSQM